MKKVLKWGAIVFVGLMVLGALASNGSSNKTNSNTSTNTTSNQTETQTTKQQAQNTPQVYKLNEPAQSDNLTFTVTGVEQKRTLGSQYYKRNAQGTFYIITLKIENIGKQTVTFDRSMAKIIDNQEREFEHSIDGQSALSISNNKTDLFLQQIQPSLSYTGDLVFDLPEGIENPTLLVKGGYFTKGAKIELQ